MLAIALFPVWQHLQSGLELFDAVILGKVFDSGGYRRKVGS